MQAQTLINAALRSIGVIASGETPSSSEMQDGLEALTMMFRNWFSQNLIVFTSVKENFSLTIGDYEYTIGTGGDFSTDRPYKIEGAFIRDGGNDYPIDCTLNEADFWHTALKTNQSRPKYLFYKPEFPLGKIYLHNAPDSAYSMHLWSQKPLDDLSGLTATTEFPGNYDEVVKWNLAINLAPEFGVEPSQIVYGKAEDSLNKIISLNASLKVKPVSIDVTRTSERWNIMKG